MSVAQSNLPYRNCGRLQEPQETSETTQTRHPARPIQPSVSELWTTPRASGDLQNYADRAPSSPNPTFLIGSVENSKSLRRPPKLRRQGTQLAQSNLPYRNCRGVLCAAEHGRPHRSTADHTGARQTTQEHGARQNRSTAEHTGARQNTPRTHADTRATTYLRGRPTTEHTSHAWWTKATLPVLVRSGS